MNSTVKTVVFWVVIALSGALLWTVIQQGRSGQKEAEINFSQFMSDVDQGKVHEEGSPEAIFGSPRQPRTQEFLKSIIAAGRL